MKFPIDVDPAIRRVSGRVGGKMTPWKACEPFVENSMAALIHRPRYVTTHKIGPRWDAHIAVHGWCNNCATGTRKFTFLDSPPVGRIVCARCEDAAVAAGLPSSSEIAGRHVHTGGVVAVARCCDHIEEVRK